MNAQDGVVALDERNDVPVEQLTVHACNPPLQACALGLLMQKR